MKLIQPSVEIWEQPKDNIGICKQIEKVARVCYKSEDKITDDSAEPFVNRLIQSKHLAMLEHGTVYLKMFWSGRVCDSCGQTLPAQIDKYCINPYSEVFYRGNDVYITTNYRVIVENKWEKDLIYLCEPTEYHNKRVTVHFICDMGVAREFTRHRTMSMAQESTRYCNYSKDKFDNGLTFIVPSWVRWTTPCTINGNGDLHSDRYVAEVDSDGTIASFFTSLATSEKEYLCLLSKGWKPEQARAVLPLSLKTELVLTGFMDSWKNFFNLRAKGTTGKPHPQAKELAEPLMNEFIKRGYILE